jgi:hypothetical protein
MPDPVFHGLWIGALIFSVLFIVLQSFLLVDFAWAWALQWIHRWEETQDDYFKYMLLGTCALFYMLVLAGSTVMLVFFGPPRKLGCQSNTVLIGVNLVLSLVHSVLSILPRIQEHTPRSGLFQSAFLSMYTTYLIMSAISSLPPEADIRCGLNPQGDEGLSQTMVYVGVLLTLLALGYSAFSSGSASSSLFEPLTQHEPEDGRQDDQGDGEEDEEHERCVYNYSLFHVVFVLAFCYSAMVLTDWRIMERDPSMPNGVNVVHGAAAPWIKIGTSYLCIALYMWTLVAPLVLPDRDFS